MTQVIDRDGRSTIAAAEGQAALSSGDTDRARERFAEAGEILEREMRGTDDETAHLLRFLAATQYYKGGQYLKALRLGERIVAAELPGDARRLLPKFMADVRERAAPEYAARIGEQLSQRFNRKDFVGVVETLQEHPYVLPPAKLAFVRAVCCEMMGKYRPAVLFFADAARWAPHDPGVLSALVPLPLSLAGQGRLQEAWDYVRVQLELFPNVVSHLVASLLCFHQARQATGEERIGFYQDVARYFTQARAEFERLAPAQQSDLCIRAVMGRGFEAAAFALSGAGDKSAARAMCEAAIAFDPPAPSAWTLLGEITFGTDKAVEAFEKAIELGDRTYFPFYFLASDAVMKGDYRAALGRSQQALDRGEKQAGTVKSLLYQWQAISLSHLGGARDEIEGLFMKAIEAAPESELARENYRRFLVSEQPETPALPPIRPEGPGWLNGGPDPRFGPSIWTDQIDARMRGIFAHTTAG